LKLQVVREISFGIITAEQAVEKYDISARSLIIDWIKQYSCYIPPEPMPKKKELTSEQEKIKQLESALKNAELKILGLETLINVAEKELKVDIRKKPGTKQ
jgi:transposase-like protein